MSAPLGGGGYWYDIISVMGVGAAAGYIAESPDLQISRVDLKGGGATTAMKESWSGCVLREGQKTGA